MIFSRPILLHYYLTYKCDCHCRFCDIWRSDEYQKAPFANIDDIVRNVQQARQLGVRFVDFTGGEPLLHPNLPRALNAAKKTGLQTSITTSCMTYPERANELHGLVNLLHFSLDSLDADQHNKIRGVNVFANVMQSIELALELGERPDLLFTITEDNADQLSALADFAQRKMLMLIVNPVFSHHKTRQLDEELLTYIESFASKPYVYVNKAFHTLRRKGGNNIKNPRCRVVSSTLVVSPENELLLPCFHFYQHKIPIHESLLDAYNCAERKHFEQQQGRFEFCNGCTLNCYFDPSFNYKLDTMFIQSLAAKAKYAFDKYIRW